MATNKAMVVLQENSGEIPFDQFLPPHLRQQIESLVDGLSETFEDLKTRFQAAGKYDVVHLLTDVACTRANLLKALVAETAKGRTIDLVVLGHGAPEELFLHQAPHLTGGEKGNIRQLLPDAQAMGADRLNLRLVYMCNCYGSTTSDDWLVAGAGACVAPKELDVMPEPMTTFFLHYWLGGKSAQEAAQAAYDASVPFFTPVLPPKPKICYRDMDVDYPALGGGGTFATRTKRISVPDGVEFVPNSYIQQSRLLVAGDGNAAF
jgi:hypothetical protein